MTSSLFSIGVDGGGTKTELILCDASGNVVSRHTAPGCNPSHTGPEKARATLDAALAALLAGSGRENQRPNISATLLFMAGAPAFWHEYASALQGYGAVSAAPDSLPVLELATDGAPGIVIHAGTGSFIGARGRDGSIHYAGGLGWKIGDPGSGFDLGRRGIASALLELQGWSDASPLAQALRVHTGLQEVRDITRFFYSEAEANACIAAFARVVLDLADTGCSPAQAALAASLDSLLDQAGLVITRLFPESKTGIQKFRVGVSGAILNRPAVAAQLSRMIEARGWPADLRFISEPPIEGVRRLLARL